MARLNGGKVLLDLKDYNTSLSSYTLNLTWEQVESILNKGLTIRIKECVRNCFICCDLIPKAIEDSRILYYPLNNDDGDTIQIDLSFSIGVNGTLKLVIE